jgi:hypothetical protein
MGQMFWRRAFVGVVAVVLMVSGVMGAHRGGYFFGCCIFIVWFFLFLYLGFFVLVFLLCFARRFSFGDK